MLGCSLFFLFFFFVCQNLNHPFTVFFFFLKSPNILDNMGDTPLANVTRIVLALTMCLTFPLDFFVVRYTVQRTVQRCCRGEWDDDEPYSGGRRSGDGGRSGRSRMLAFSPVFTRQHLRGQGHASDLNTCNHASFTIFVWGFCMGSCVLAMKNGGLGIVLQLTGSIGTIFTAFVFPTATFLRLGTNDSLLPEQSICCWCCTPNMYRLFRYFFAWCVLSFGVVSGCIGSYVAVKNSMHSHV